jgi:hypothetical protein
LQRVAASAGTVVAVRFALTPDDTRQFRIGIIIVSVIGGALIWVF